ncbi:MAG: HD-GYP domain-containing protein [Chloroflexi bacterium]|nr:HD-GYP domain-containing protein [Chloroflexota bacterium]
MRRQLPLRARLYVWAVVACAAGFLAFWLHAWRGPAPLELPNLGLVGLLLVLAMVASHFPLRVSRQYEVEVTNAVHFACLLLFGPVATMLVAGVSMCAGQVTSGLWNHWRSGKLTPSVQNVLFNTAYAIIYAGFGGAVYYTFLPQSAPAPLGRIENVWAIPATALAMYLTGRLLVTTIIGLKLGRNPLQFWLADWKREAPQEAGLFLLGLVTARTASHDPWIPLVMVLPAAIIYLSLKRWVQLVEQTIAAVEALADVVDRRDRYTFEHSKRVAAYAEQIARAMGVPAGEAETIRLAARVHDLGKIGVPDAVLLKQGRLTPEEFDEMKRHPQIGHDILSRFPEYRRGRELVVRHHERYDGRGYPDGLAGNRVALGAQIIAVADAFDAMTSDRPYRAALSLGQATADLRRGKGTQFHPAVVEALELVLAQERGPAPHDATQAPVRRLAPSGA